MAFIPEHEEDIVKCMKCGNCQYTCPVYTITMKESQVARGRIRLLKAVAAGEIEMTDGVQESLLTCLQCDACRVSCPPGVPVNEMLLDAKAAMLKAGKVLPESQETVRGGITGKKNPYNQPLEERGAWLPPKYREPKPAEYLMHAGCAVSYSQNRIGKAVIRILEKAGVDFTLMGDQEECCGDPLIRMGDMESAQKQIDRNKEEWKKLGVKKIITPCAGCIKALKEHYSDEFETMHVVQLMDQLVQEGKLSFRRPFKKKVVYFDGCDIGRHSEIYEEPRRVLDAIPELERVEFARNREDAVCCGGPALSGYPDMARKIAADRIREADKLGADVLVVACPTCLLNLKEGAREAGIKMDVQDLNALLMRVV